MEGGGGGAGVRGVTKSGKQIMFKQELHSFPTKKKKRETKKEIQTIELKEKSHLKTLKNLYYQDDPTGGSYRSAEPEEKINSRNSSKKLEARYIN